jgi:hypothetical protein
VTWSDDEALSLREWRIVAGGDAEKITRSDILKAVLTADGGAVDTYLPDDEWDRYEGSWDTASVTMTVGQPYIQLYSTRVKVAKQEGWLGKIMSTLLPASHVPGVPDTSMDPISWLMEKTVSALSEKKLKDSMKSAVDSGKVVPADVAQHLAKIAGTLKVEVRACVVELQDLMGMANSLVLPNVAYQITLQEDPTFNKGGALIFDSASQWTLGESLGESEMTAFSTWDPKQGGKPLIFDPTG